MTRRNSLSTIHEPFGDAFYYGPERIGTRFENDEKTREESGFADSTYETILDRIENEASEEVRAALSYLVPLLGAILIVHRASESSSRTLRTTSSHRRSSLVKSLRLCKTSPSVVWVPRTR